MGSGVARGGVRPTLAGVSGTVTFVVELAVGVGCVLAAVPALGRRPLRWLGVVLLVAGVAAIVHATIRLVG
jgi:hypothetical protein